MSRTLFNRAIITGIAFCLTAPSFAADTMSFLGQSPEAAMSDGNNMAQVGLSNSTPTPITTVTGPNGTRNANFDIYNKDGNSYIQSGSFGQVFPGSSMTQNSGNWIVERPNGGRLQFMIMLNQMILLFCGQQTETGIQAYEENGNTYLPLNTMGQFYGQDFTQSGSQLNTSQSPAQAPWLQTSWNNTLNQSGATNYSNQIGTAVQNTTPGNSKVFKNITATVFSSIESNKKGAYGEWLKKDALFIALPRRFKGKRPWVAVQGPKGTYKAEIKDVGPWNINDPYWETGARPQAETGRDKTGRKTNLAGIDLSFKLGQLVGIGGKGKVNWWFVK